MSEVNKSRTMFAITIMIGSLLMTQNVNYAESVYERAVTTTVESEQPHRSTVAETEETEATSEQKTAESIQVDADPSINRELANQAVSHNVITVPDGMEAIAENEELILYLQPETTEIATLDKQHGEMWFSNPQDRKQDAIATGYNKSQLNVQFELTYYDNAGNALKYDNYTHSVQSGQFEIEKVEDGVNIVYTLGEVKSDIEAIPKYISEERFRTLILEKLEEKDQKELEKRCRYDEQNKRNERRESYQSNPNSGIH